MEKNNLPQAGTPDANASQPRALLSQWFQSLSAAVGVGRMLDVCSTWRNETSRGERDEVVQMNMIM